MNKWRKYKLSEVVDELRGISYGVVQPGTFLKQGISFIRVNNLTEGKLSIEDVEKISPEIEAKYKRTRLTGNELLVSLVGSLGHVGYVKESMIGWNVARAVGVLPIKTEFDRDWIYWCLKGPAVQEQLHRNATTSVQATLNLKELQEIEIAYPDEYYRKKAVAILSSLDDKIALNRRMNQTLEQMAATLFKKYFVEDIDPENLPEGWSYLPLCEVIDIKHGFAFKGEFFSDEETQEVLLTPGNFKIGGGFNYNKFKFYKGEVPLDYILEEGDLIVTMTDLSKDGDTLGYPAFVPTIKQKRLLHNQRIGKVVFKYSNNLKYYLQWLMRTNDYRSFVLGGATGTTVRHTSPSRICEYKCIIPSGAIVEQFNAQVETLIKRQFLNEQESQQLAIVRDTLLPRLLSGELDPTTINQNSPLHAEVFS